MTSEFNTTKVKTFNLNGSEQIYSGWKDYLLFIQAPRIASWCDNCKYYVTLHEHLNFLSSEFCVWKYMFDFEKSPEIHILTIQ